jgi:hypothetical protein
MVRVCPDRLLPTNDLFHYIFQFDYIDENVIDKTLTLGEQGLTFTHYYSIGNPKYNEVDALSAKFSIELDPKNNTFKGHFEATFGSNVKSPQRRIRLNKTTSQKLMTWQAIPTSGSCPPQWMSAHYPLWDYSL